MDPLRFYLLAGLLAHKAVWEALKRRSPAPPSPGAASFKTRVVKLVKVGILLGIAVQTLLPDILPIAADPAPLRAAGAFLYTVGLAMALAGRLQLGDNWSDIETAVVRHEHRVVSRGIYRYIRHPIYSGDLMLLVGLELALNSWLVAGPLLLIPVVVRQAIREEASLRESLPGYEAYCRRTKRFLPIPGLPC